MLPDVPTMRYRFCCNYTCAAACAKSDLMCKIIQLVMHVSWTAEDNVLTGGLFPPGFDDWEHVQSTMDLPNENFCRALYDMYIGPQSIVPDGRQHYAQGLLELLKL
jgi:hypothetical protein